MKEIRRRPSDFRDPECRCSIEVLVSFNNFIGYDKIEELLDSLLEAYKLSPEEVSVLCNVTSHSKDRVRVKLRVEYLHESDLCMAVLEQFVHGLGNVLIYERKMNYAVL